MREWWHPCQLGAPAPLVSVIHSVFFLVLVQQGWGVGSVRFVLDIRVRCFETLEFISVCVFVLGGWTPRCPPAGLTSVWLGRWEGERRLFLSDPSRHPPQWGCKDGRCVRLEHRHCLSFCLAGLCLSPSCAYREQPYG